MLFRRRKSAKLKEKLRVSLWPRRSFRRSFQYFGKRILRFSGSPHAIALGFAIGIFTSCTPFLGLHIFLGVLISWLFAANIAASIIATAFATPFIPALFAATYATGRFIMQVRGKYVAMTFEQFSAHLKQFNFVELWSVLLQLLIGTAIVGLLCGFISYVVIYWLTLRFRHRQKIIRGRKIHAKTF